MAAAKMEALVKNLQKECDDVAMGNDSRESTELGPRQKPKH
jgi:hypothetical protein